MEYSAKNTAVSLPGRLFCGRGQLSRLRSGAATHPALFLLIPLAALLIFFRLGDTVLQVDEGADTFISTTILKSGLPRHSDGVNATMLYADVRDGVFVYRTWVPYYLQAGSLALFGNTAFAARLPFALAGVLSVVALYVLAFKWSGSRKTAFLAALFLACSVPALLYFRTARYIALPILLTPLLLHFYTQIFDKKCWNPWPFTVTAIVYFHTMYVEFAGTILGMALHFFFRRAEITVETKKKIALSATVTALFCLPWLVFIHPVFAKISEFYHTTSRLIDTSLLGWLKHFAGFLFQANNHLFPFILLPLLLFHKARHAADPVRLCLLVIVSLFAAGSLHAIPLHQYVAAALPLFFFLLAVVVVECIPGGRWVRTGVAAVLIATNLLHVGPLYPFKPFFNPDSRWVADNPYFEYAARTFQREVAPNSHLYRYSLEMRQGYRGPLDEVVGFLKTYGKPGQTCYIDNEPDALAFHTGLRVLADDALDENHRPDWIVLRGDRIGFRTAQPEDRVSRILNNLLDRHPYWAIPTDITAGRINNSYDVQLHRFQPVDTGDTVTVYRLHSKPVSTPQPPTPSTLP